MSPAPPPARVLAPGPTRRPGRRGLRPGLLSGLLALLTSGVALGQGASELRPDTRPGASGDEALTTAVTREALVELAIERSPSLTATRARARASRLEGEAEARLPPPMAEVQVWQIPIASPSRLDRAGMVMAGVKQEFPPAGARRARARAARLVARVEDAMVDEQARELAAEVEHAFADYVEATELVRVHEEHRQAAERVAAFARARYAAGGSLPDLAQAERELAMIEPTLAAARAEVEVAKARLNGLLRRDTGAPLGPPSVPAAGRARAEARALVAEAEAARPELQVARAQRVAAEAMADAESRMARAPMLSAGLYYFAPSEPMPENGFGASFSTTLPWLWGAPRARSRAAAARVDAALAEEDAVRARVALEVMTAAAEVAAAQSRLEAIEIDAIPASQRAAQATLAGYESARAEILAALMARTAVVNTEVEAVMARAELEHALTELRWATGRAGANTAGEPPHAR